MFFTEVKIERNPGAIRHGEKIWSIGSCFADEIGRRMADALFDIRVNPCGTLYNSFSIANALDRIATGSPYTEADIFLHNGLWHCMDFHSSFSGTDATAVLNGINDTIAELHAELPHLRLLMVTFGSARAFIDRTTGMVAGNCHKLPASRFEVRDFTADEITKRFSQTINRLRAISPQLKVIYTVSPIRHKAYGFHADRISKANLLIAADELCRHDESALYFPAYEIMNDELRDYRFYAADLTHPSEEAVEYIWEKFQERYLTDAARTLLREGEKVMKALSHRPIIACDIPEIRSRAEDFRRQAEERYLDFIRRHPDMGIVPDTSAPGVIIHNSMPVCEKK